MKRWLATSSIAFLGLAGLLATDAVYRGRIRSSNSRLLSRAAEHAAMAVTAAVADPMAATEDLRAFMLAAAKLPDDETFERFAKLLLQHHPQVRAVQYAGSDLLVHWTVPKEGNETATSLDPTTPPTRPFVEKGVRERRLTVSETFLTEQGVPSIVLRGPLYRGDDFLGFVQTLVAIDRVLDVARHSLGGTFEGQLRDATGALFWGKASNLDGETSSESIPVGDSRWTLLVGWRGAPPAPDVFVLGLIWGIGGLLSLSLALLVKRTWLRPEGLDTELEERTRALATKLAEGAEGQAVLQTSDREYRTPFGRTRECILIWDSDSRLISANPAAARLLGYGSPEAMVGMQLMDLLDDRKQQKAFLGRLVSNGYVENFEMTLRRRDGKDSRVHVLGKAISRWDATERVQPTEAFLTDGTERKRSEEQILLQANMLDAVGSAVIAAEPDGRVIYWNRAAEMLYGWCSSEALGQNMVDLTLTDQTKEQARKIMEQLGLGKPWSGELLVKKKDGSPIPAFVVDSPVLDSAGRMIGIIGVSNDLTERKRMDETLRETESLLRTVLGNAPITIFATDREGVFTLSEGKGLEGVGLKPGENVGQSAIELYGSSLFIDETGNEVLGRDVLRRALAGDTVTVSNELRGVHFINRVGPMQDADGRVIGVVGVATDITDQKRMERELRLHKELLQTIVDNIPVMIAFIDPSGRTQWINRHWEHVLGWSLEEATSRDILRDMYPDRKRRQEVLEFALMGGGAWRDFRSRTKHGRVIDTSWANVLLSDGTCISIGRDISQRKQAEAAMRQRTRELETLLAISRRLSAELDVDELLRAIVQSVVDTLPGAEAASLWLYDGVRDRFVPRSWTGHREESFAGLELPPDTTLVGRVFRSGETLFVGDVSEDPDFIHLGRPGLDHLQSVIGAPLRIRGQVVGALFGDNFSQIEAFGESDLLLLQGLAAQAGIALGNARLFEQVKRSRERIRALSKRLTILEEEERRELSKRLHDDVSQSLTALGVNLAFMRERIGNDPAETLVPRMEVAQDMLAEVTERIRDVMTELHPPVLDDYGLLAALRWYAERLSVSTGLQVEIKGQALVPPLQPATAMQLLRIAQEALTNVVKHAGVETAVVVLEGLRNGVRLSIVDEGTGFDPATLSSENGVHWGLTTMRERTEALGGDMLVESVPGGGTRVVVEAPR